MTEGEGPGCGYLDRENGRSGSRYGRSGHGHCPEPGVKDLAAKLRATVDRHGFLTEAHIKLYPVESSTKGIYLAGCGQSPKDISDTVSQASATASKIQALLSTDKLLQDPLIAFVDEGICSGCGICVEICPYEAREMDAHRGISIVHRPSARDAGPALPACPNNACELRNASASQVLQNGGYVCNVKGQD